MMHCLVVDDNLEHAENLRELLELNGFRIEIATEPLAAIALLKRRTDFDAVITDMKMPVLSGAEFVCQVRQVAPTVPVMAITAFTRDEELRRVEHCGVSGIFFKPLAIEPLCNAMRRLRSDALIVIVEDDEAISENLAQLLRAVGFSVARFGSVAALQAAGPLNPFASIVDLSMPPSTFGAAADAVHHLWPQCNTILLTAFEPGRWAHQASATIAKPFLPERLLNQIEMYWERHMAMEQLSA